MDTIDTFDLLIIFTNRPDQIIRGVSGYGWHNSAETFYFTRSNAKCFVPKENVLYFGPLKDWRSE